MKTWAYALAPMVVLEVRRASSRDGQLETSLGAEGSCRCDVET